MTAQPPPLIRKSASLADLHRIAATAVRLLHDLDELDVDYGRPQERLEDRCAELIAVTADRAADIPATSAAEAALQLAFAIQHIERLDGSIPEGSPAEARLYMIKRLAESACAVLYGLTAAEVDGELVRYLSGVAGTD